MRTEQTCIGHVQVFEVEVPSSKGDKTYKIKGLVRDGNVTCECDGFKYRGKCRHLNLQTQPCGWSESDAELQQTKEELAEHLCPRCGNQTLDAVVGVSL